MSKTILFYGSVFGLLIAASGCRDRVEESKRAGDEIVHALNKYKSAAGSYPDSLDELVPKYLQKIPLPTYGEEKWNYFRHKKDTGCHLSFGDKHGSLTTTWNSESEIWHSVDF